MGRIVRERGIHQLAGLRKAFVLLHHAVGAQILGFGQALDDLTAQVGVLGAVRQAVHGIRQGLFGGGVVALAQRGETGIGSLERIGFGGLAAHFFLLGGFLGDFLEFLGIQFLFGLAALAARGRLIRRAGGEISGEIFRRGFFGRDRGQFFRGSGDFFGRGGLDRRGFFREQIAEQVRIGRRRRFFGDGRGFHDGGFFGDRGGFFNRRSSFGRRRGQIGNRIGGRRGCFRDEALFRDGRLFNGGGFGHRGDFRGRRFFRNRRGFFGDGRLFRDRRFGRRRSQIGKRIGGRRGFRGHFFDDRRRLGDGRGFGGDGFRRSGGIRRLGRGTRVAQQGIQIEIAFLGKRHAAEQERHRHRRDHAPFHRGLLLGTQTRTKLFPRPTQHLFIDIQHTQITTPEREPRRQPERSAGRASPHVLRNSTGGPSRFRRFSCFELLQNRGGCQRPCIPRRAAQTRR